MPTITAVPPVSTLADLSPPKPGGEGADGFAPVIAALLATGESVPVQGAPLMPDRSGASPAPALAAEVTGTALPPTGTTAPLAGAPGPITTDTAPAGTITTAIPIAAPKPGAVPAQPEPPIRTPERSPTHDRLGDAVRPERFTAPARRSAHDIPGQASDPSRDEQNAAGLSDEAASLGPVDRAPIDPSLATPSPTFASPAPVMAAERPAQPANTGTPVALARPAAVVRPAEGSTTKLRHRPDADTASRDTNDAPAARLFSPTAPETPRALPEAVRPTPPLFVPPPPIAADSRSPAPPFAPKPEASLLPAALPSSPAADPIAVGTPLANSPPATTPLSPIATQPRLDDRITAAAPAATDRTAAPVVANQPGPPSPAQAAAILPALQAFGAALHRAAVDERRPFTREPVDIAPSAPLTASPTTAPVTDPAPLDTTQSRWPDQMIARIEQLRDTANAPGSVADTRIRLHPDALGTVDVALRREGERVHVQLTAAEPATVRLLADAQPRLAELADARGLKLGQASVDGGGANANANGGERRPPATPQPTRPRPAPSAATPDTDPDTRLA